MTFGGVERVWAVKDNQSSPRRLRTGRRDARLRRNVGRPEGRRLDFVRRSAAATRAWCGSSANATRQEPDRACCGTVTVRGERLCSRSFALQWLAEICVRRPVFALMLVLAMVVAGVAAYQSMGIDRFPKMDLPSLMVFTNYPAPRPTRSRRRSRRFSRMPWPRSAASTSCDRCRATATRC